MTEGGGQGPAGAAPLLCTPSYADVALKYRGLVPGELKRRKMLISIVNHVHDRDAPCYLINTAVKDLFNFLPVTEIFSIAN